MSNSSNCEPHRPTTYWLEKAYDRSISAFVFLDIKFWISLNFVFKINLFKSRFGIAASQTMLSSKTKGIIFCLTNEASSLFSPKLEALSAWTSAKHWTKKYILPKVRWQHMLNWSFLRNLELSVCYRMKMLNNCKCLFENFLWKLVSSEVQNT